MASIDSLRKIPYAYGLKFWFQLIVGTIVAAVSGGLIWGFLKTSGIVPCVEEQPHGWCAWMWGTFTTFCAAFPAMVVVLLNLPHQEATPAIFNLDSSRPHWLLASSYSILAGLGALLFYDSGLRERMENPAVSSRDIRDFESLTAKLRQPTDEVSIYLRAKLPERTRQLLMDRHGDWKTLLLAGLNTLLRQEQLFNERPFSQLLLRTTTLKLVHRLRTDADAQKDGKNRVMLNRLLLEDAYPNEISRKLGEELREAIIIVCWAFSISLASFFSAPMFPKIISWRILASQVGVIPLLCLISLSAFYLIDMWRIERIRGYFAAGALHAAQCFMIVIACYDPLAGCLQPWRNLWSSSFVMRKRVWKKLAR
ncbi:MAG: hypothetical protein L0Z50_27730 [Verrucomicrobiales bacterium]|nr:hypothetical protein [Verrucomicrobiales bacterium]